MTRSHRIVPCFSLACVLALGACGDEEPTALTGPDFGVTSGEAGPPAEISAYTQNMFLGGDTRPLFSLDFSDLPAVIAATAGFYGQVLASDVPGRVAAFADELEANEPTIVALQEAVGYATGFLNPQTFQFAPTAPGPNLLGSLMGEIAARGLPYRIAVLLPTSGIALPTGAPTPQGLPALGVQDHIAILVHEEVDVAATDRGLYAVKVVLGPLAVDRGWASVTVQHDGATYHFVTTHLETQGTPAPGDPLRAVHNAQAAELQSVIAALDGNVVLLGDLNSDALADPSANSWTPTYGSLLDAGFIDVWNEAPRAGSDHGGTCCLLPGRELNERIDFVLMRPADSGDRDEGRHRGFFRAAVVNTVPVAPDVWPSDHAGLTASITQPGPTR